MKVSGCTMQDELSKSKVYPCRVCNLRIKLMKCGKWIYSRCLNEESIQKIDNKSCLQEILDSQAV